MIFGRIWLLTYFVPKGGDTWRFWTIVHDYYYYDYDDESGDLSIWLTTGSWNRPVGLDWFWLGFGHRFVDSSGWFGIGLEVETFHLDPFLLDILYNNYFWIYEKFNQVFEELSLVVIVRVWILSIWWLFWDIGIIPLVFSLRVGNLSIGE